MSGAGLNDMMWWGGWGLALGAAAAVLWALFADRSRGRLRCPSCWYDMHGIGSTGGRACPECGRSVKSERAMRRTRRRWRVAAAGVVGVLLGVQTAEQVNRGGEGWTRVVPTSALVFMARPQGQIGRDPGSSAINTAIAGRDVRGWRGAVAEWMVYSRDEAALRKCLTTRPHWPAGTPIDVRLIPSIEAYPLFESVGIRAWAMSRADPAQVARIAADPPHLFVTYSGEQPRNWFTLPGRGPGKYCEHVVVEVRSWGWVIARRTVQVCFEVAPTLNDVVRPMSSSELDVEVSKALGVMSFGGDDDILYEVCWPIDVDELTGTAVRGEVLLDGRVVATLDDKGCFLVLRSGNPREGPSIVKVEGDDLAKAASARIRLRLRGDQAATLRTSYAQAYWVGEVEVGLAELIERMR